MPAGHEIWTLLEEFGIRMSIVPPTTYCPFLWILYDFKFGGKASTLVLCER